MPDEQPISAPSREVIAAAENLSLSGNHTADITIIGNSGERLTAADLKMLHAQLDVLALKLPKPRTSKSKPA